MSFPYTVPLTDKEVRTPTTTQRAPLGTRGATPDGRIFRYAKNGATALTKGLLCQGKVQTTAWSNTTASYISTAFLTELGTTDIAAGTTYLHLTATGDTDLTVTKDLFKEGWIWVSGTATSAGQLMKIKTNNVASSGSTGYSATGGQLYVEFEAGYALSDPIDTAAEVSVCENEYDGVVVSATTATAELVGVPAVNVAASRYFWIQTWGPCAMKSEAEAITSGKTVWNSTQTAGCIQGVTGSTDITGTDAIAGGIVGRIVQSSADAVLQASCNILVHLTLAP